MANPRATVILDAKDQTGQAFRSVGQKFKKLDRASTKLTKNFGKIGAALAVVAGAGAVTRQFDQLIESIEKLSIVSEQLGLSIGFLDGFSAATERVGVNQDQLRIALTAFNKNIQDFKVGVGEGARALRLMGLNAKDFVGLNLEEKIKLVSTEMQRTGSAALQADIAYRLFGESGTKLVPILRQGGTALQAQVDAWNKLGVITDDQVEQAQKLRVAQALLNRELRSLALDILPPVIAVVTVIVQHFREFISLIVEFVKENSTLIKQIAKVVTAFGLVGPIIDFVNRKMAEAQTNIIPGLSEEFIDLNANLLQTAKTMEIVALRIPELLPERELIRGTSDGLAELATGVAVVGDAIQSNLTDEFRLAFDVAIDGVTFFEKVALDVINTLGAAFAELAIQTALSAIPGIGPFLALGFGTQRTPQQVQAGKNATNQQITRNRYGARRD